MHGVKQSRVHMIIQCMTLHQTRSNRLTSSLLTVLVGNRAKQRFDQMFRGGGMQSLNQQVIHRWKECISFVFQSCTLIKIRMALLEVYKFRRPSSRFDHQAH